MEKGDHESWRVISSKLMAKFQIPILYIYELIKKILGIFKQCSIIHNKSKNEIFFVDSFTNTYPNDLGVMECVFQGFGCPNGALLHYFTLPTLSQLPSKAQGCEDF